MMLSIAEESKKIKITVSVVLVIFFITCIFTSLYYGNRLLLGSFEKFENDDVRYLRSAETLINTGKLTYAYPEKSTAFIMPGMVFVLVPFVKIFGLQGAVMPFRIFNALLQTITLYNLFLITRKLFGKKPSVILLIALSIYIPNIYITTLVLTETIFLFLFVLLILVSIYAIQEKKLKYYIIGGLFWGLATLFRPAISLYPLIILIMFVIKRYKAGEIIKFGLFAAIPFIILMAPWWIRNYIVFDRFIPFTLSTGNPALQGAFIDNDVDYELIAKLNTDNLRYENDEIVNNEIEMEFARRVTKYNFENKFWQFLKWNIFGKTFMNLSNGYYGNQIKGVDYTLIYMQHRIYVLWGFAGIALSARKRFRNEWKVLIVGIIVYFILVHLPFLGYSRYLYPAIPFIVMMGASIFTAEGRKTTN